MAAYSNQRDSTFTQLLTDSTLSAADLAAKHDAIQQAKLNDTQVPFENLCTSLLERQRAFDDIPCQKYGNGHKLASDRIHQPCMSLVDTHAAIGKELNINVDKFLNKTGDEFSKQFEQLIREATDKFKEVIIPKEDVKDLTSSPESWGRFCTWNTLQNFYVPFPLPVHAARDIFTMDIQFDLPETTHEAFAETMKKKGVISIPVNSEEVIKYIEKQSGHSFPPKNQGLFHILPKTITRVWEENTLLCDVDKILWSRVIITPPKNKKPNTGVESHTEWFRKIGVTAAGQGIHDVVDHGVVKSTPTVLYDAADYTDSFQIRQWLGVSAKRERQDFKKIAKYIKNADGHRFIRMEWPAVDRKEPIDNVWWYLLLTRYVELTVNTMKWLRANYPDSLGRLNWDELKIGETKKCLMKLYEDDNKKDIWISYFPEAAFFDLYKGHVITEKNTKKNIKTIARPQKLCMSMNELQLQLKALHDRDHYVNKYDETKLLLCHKMAAYKCRLRIEFEIFDLLSVYSETRKEIVEKGETATIPLLPEEEQVLSVQLLDANVPSISKMVTGYHPGVTSFEITRAQTEEAQVLQSTLHQYGFDNDDSEATENKDCEKKLQEEQLVNAERIQALQNQLNELSKSTLK
jgi:hypothetical protein